MALVWQNYQTDLGRSYPMFSLAVGQINDVPSNINPVDLLPPAVTNSLLRVRTSCAVNGLTPRVLILYLTDGAQYRLTYPQPFSENLADYLTANLQIQAWEFVGERLKDGRLRKMLGNV